MRDERLERVLRDIDTYNERDPHHREKPYSERLTHWVLQLKPDASAALRIAARGQHIGRWTVPREAYPMDRGGYLRWRENLKRFHATTVAEIMEKQGYSSEEVDQVRRVILKKNIQGDPDTQTLEDALCLIFLESQFEELKRKTPDAKMVDIIRKTWRKMSVQGQTAALSLELPREHRTLIESALR